MNDLTTIVTAAISECDYAQTTISRFAIEMKCVFVLAAAIVAAVAIVAVQVFLFFKFKYKTESNMIVVNLLVIE